MDAHPLEPQGDFVRPEIVQESSDGQDDTGGNDTGDNETGEHGTSSKKGWISILVPLVLFGATCFSTFWAGTFGLGVLDFLVDPARASWILVNRWPDGLLYMALVMGILLAHELGHFLQALRYRVPASLPFFLPMPFALSGTMGAVIAMQTSGANRKQLFDIGISGPWAGLFVAVPIICMGILTAAPFPSDAVAGVHFPDPLLVQGLIW